MGIEGYEIASDETAFVSTPWATRVGGGNKKRGACSRRRLTQCKLKNEGTRFFATCARGLGTLLGEELKSAPIKANVTQIHASGVQFESVDADDSVDSEFAHGVRACLHSRLATRVLQELGTMGARRKGRIGYDEVYSTVREVFADGVDRWLDGGALSFRVQARVGSQVAVNERVAATAGRDAILDCLRASGAERGQRPESYGEASVPVFVAVSREGVTVYRDLAGVSLHKRGFRSGRMHVAALNECVAAGMLRLGGAMELRDGFVMDPMCGGGTICTEAGLMATRTPAGWFRGERFAFSDWTDVHGVQLLRAERAEAEGDMLPAEEAPFRVVGSDRHAGATALAQQHVRDAGLLGVVSVRCADAAQLSGNATPQLVVCNPPWGSRLGADAAWATLGAFLRRCAGDDGVTAVVLSGERGATRALAMRARTKVALRVGDVQAAALVYDVLPRRSP
ncbi:Ribosomal RNA large subunit methyltransferase K/L [Gracilariopsis chorda]|uniref:Ribosomal RNA large subunit methyltransferase K/L n=1 Tax=Gracilariopsis chorda TaxID=448386 RepID=A0A2V3J3N4_9FLOR|nr:Ribosomal RNA large subunit methyltransferase K/L [Gracilariopsis chorda]|eukprot:PXF48979.1 Ribosomal RNA large subunit methyltransferase K/L [Gracilariopsis chorda]